MNITEFESKEGGPKLSLSQDKDVFSDNKLRLQHCFSILLIEDNELNQKVLRKMLEIIGCRVEITGTGELGVEKARTNSYDLIITDIGLPGISGIEAAAAIRTIPSQKNTPIIAVTAFSDVQEQCFAAGINDYISKPVDIAHLSKTIARLLEHTPSNVN